jgi:hypothetical protein
MLIIAHDCAVHPWRGKDQMEIWELVARESARDLIARYNANGDSGRWDQMEELFASDATMDVDGTIHDGRDEIMKMFRSVQARVNVDSGPEPQHGADLGHTSLQEWVRRGRKPFIRHFTSTTQIDVVNEEEMRARSYYFFLTVHGLDHWGRYVDRFKKVDGKWKFAFRQEVQEAAVEGGWGATPMLDNHVRVLGMAAS